MSGITVLVAAYYILCVSFLPSGVQSFILSNRDKEVCYTKYNMGCFNSGAPFRGPSRPFSTTPSKPEDIQTKFFLYTNDNLKNGQILDALKYKDVKTTWTNFKNRTTQIIVHGFIDDRNFITWMDEMKDELLKHGDYNTIIVDWHHGNMFPYTQATANTRVVGKEIALLVKQLYEDFQLDPGQIHIIGHSLGAHVAGYAGDGIKSTKSLGRITGLDPAGPYFAGTDKVVRLDPEDALLVDTIHSDGDMLLKLGFGLKSAIGDMDFYPNLGHDQPGCEKDVVNIFKLLLKNGIADSVACNHLRSIKYFIESINTKCPFNSFPCDSENDFKNNRCHSCGKQGCAAMGFNADKNKPANGKHVKYFTKTSKEKPFCQYLVNVKVSLTSLSQETYERGTMQIRLYGEKRNSNWLPLDPSPIPYYQGRSYERLVGTAEDVGKVHYVDFQWHHSAKLTSPSEWNLFGFRAPKLYLKQLDIVQEDFGRESHFCAADTAVKNNKPFTLDKPCS